MEVLFSLFLQEQDEVGRCWESWEVNPNEWRKEEKVKKKRERRRLVFCLEKIIPIIPHK